MTKSRLFFRNAMVYTILGFIPLTSSFFLLPVFTYNLTKDQYGIIALATVVQTYMAYFIALGIDAGFSRFYFKYYRKPVLTSALFSTTIISLFLGTILIYLLLLFTGDGLFQKIFSNPAFTFHEFGLYILLQAAFTLLYNIYLQFYRDSENIKNYAILTLMYFILITAGSLAGLFLIKDGAIGVLIGRTAGTMLIMILFLIKFYTRTNFVFKLKYAKAMYVFGLPFLLYGLLSSSFDNLDRFFINKYYSLSELGVYSLAFVVASTIGIVINSLNSSLSPAIFKMYAERENLQKICNLYRTMMAVAILTSSLCILASYPVIHLFISPDYRYAAIYIPWLALSFVPRMHYIVYSNSLFFNHKTILLTLINLVSLITGGIACFIFIRLWGIKGICFAVFCMKLSQAVMAHVFLRREGLYNKEEFNISTINILFLAFCFLATIISAGVLDNYLTLPLQFALPFIILSLCIFILFRKKYFHTV